MPPPPVRPSTLPDLSREAIYLGRMLLGILPEAEVRGLLALMLLNESRRPARTSVTGDVIVLEEQDRSLWNRELMAEGAELVKAALASREFGIHRTGGDRRGTRWEAREAAATGWAKIARWYDVLYRLSPTPVVELEPRRGGCHARRPASRTGTHRCHPGAR